ncbi:DUF2716 domain-containing protein [Streptomyces sp. NPDC056352]|uniref:DUF2716 domain-containing protein n=1 Tax=Streptomyces sp. NPDC056352 TaxID=3345791 RepID=UPI0035D7547C
MEDPVAVLPEAEYRRVWDRFYAEFQFQPSTSALRWPAIKEPAASAAWSLAALDDDPDNSCHSARHRMCSECGVQFVTVEHYELITVPHCGIRAPFSRARVVTAVRTAAQGQRQVMNAAAHRRRTRGQPDIAAMLTDQTRACKAARDAIAAGGKVVVWDPRRP